MIIIDYSLIWFTSIIAYWEQRWELLFSTLLIWFPENTLESSKRRSFNTTTTTTTLSQTLCPNLTFNNYTVHSPWRINLLQMKAAPVPSMKTLQIQLFTSISRLLIPESTLFKFTKMSAIISNNPLWCSFSLLFWCSFLITYFRCPFRCSKRKLQMKLVFQLVSND
jgi:hypothetical protein